MFSENGKRIKEENDENIYNDKMIGNLDLFNFRYKECINHNDYEEFRNLILLHLNDENAKISFDNYKIIPIIFMPNCNQTKREGYNLTKYILYHNDNIFLKKLENDSIIIKLLTINKNELLDLFCCKYRKLDSLKFLINMKMIYNVNKCLKYLAKKDLKEYFLILWNYIKIDYFQNHILFESKWCKKLIKRDSLEIISSLFSSSSPILLNHLETIFIHDKFKIFEYILKAKWSNYHYDKFIKMMIYHESRKSLNIFIDTNIWDKQNWKSFYDKNFSTNSVLFVINSVINN